MNPESYLADELAAASTLTESDYQHIAEARSELAQLQSKREARREEQAHGEVLCMRSLAAAGASAAAGLGLVLSFTSLMGGAS